MVSREEFDAVEQRVRHLEEIVTEMTKSLQGVASTTGKQSEMLQRMPAVLEHLESLANAVKKIQEELDRVIYYL